MGTLIVGEVSYKGIVTLPAGSRSVVVTHGIGSTPYIVTAEPNQWVGDVWIDNIDATSFTIHTSASVDSDTIFRWKATM